jgi:hypothetical protein
MKNEINSHADGNEHADGQIQFVFLSDQIIQLKVIEIIFI